LYLPLGDRPKVPLPFAQALPPLPRVMKRLKKRVPIEQPVHV
jgi:hypothetical protein